MACRRARILCFWIRQDVWGRRRISQLCQTVISVLFAESQLNQLLDFAQREQVQGA
jgi:hypothetical protein